MPELVDKTIAEQILAAALKSRCMMDNDTSKSIVSILRGNHKTYKYILITGLLAKATNQKINPQALQAGAPGKGAYDARSLCHSVVVPFERDFLQNVLGGSNEPFLNKPARFTHLSNNNAVRKGTDRQSLKTLIEVFQTIRTSEEANKYLICALSELNIQIKKISLLHQTEIKHNPSRTSINEFIVRFLNKSFEGESCAVVVGALEKLYYRNFSDKYVVKVHKVNQSGASSKEIGDIDIFKDGEFSYAIEVKDKNFTAYDLEHAFNKIRNAGGSRGLFIYGPNANFDSDVIQKKLDEFEALNFMGFVRDIYDYVKYMIFQFESDGKQEFIDAVMQTAIEINCKEETKNQIQLLLHELKWK